MSEIFFVVKTFTITAAVVMLMQVRIGEATLETRAEAWLIESSVALWIQGAAAGGAVALRNMSRGVKDAVAGATDGFDEGARQQRAGR